MNRGKFMCLDCGVDTGKIFEYYLIMDELWPVGPHDGMLCVGCLEDEIGRRLEPADFTECFINKPEFTPRSARLAERMGL